MIALKRFAFLSVLLGWGLLGVASTVSYVAAAESKTMYEVWGKDARVVGTATPDNPNPGAWLRLGSSASRAGAEQTLVTLTRHGGFVFLHIRENQVNADPRRVGVKEKTNGNAQKQLANGLVQPKRPIGEIPPRTPAPGAVPRPKGIGVIPPPSATPLATRSSQK